MADTDRADKPMDDQPGKLPEPKEAGMEMETNPTENEPKSPTTNEEE